MSRPEQLSINHGTREGVRGTVEQMLIQMDHLLSAIGRDQHEVVEYWSALLHKKIKWLSFELSEEDTWQGE